MSWHIYRFGKLKNILCVVALAFSTNSLYSFGNNLEKIESGGCAITFASILAEPDPIRRLSLTEVKANLKEFRNPSEPGKVQYSVVSTENLSHQRLESTPQSLVDFFIREGAVLWPKHPFNTVHDVPYFNSPIVGEVEALFTASRSIFVKLPEERWISLKMATNRPHLNTYQSKADTYESSKRSVALSKYIENLDGILKPDKDLVILKEVFSVTAEDPQGRKSRLDPTEGELYIKGGGFTVRDLAPLTKPGHFYLPAFSIPFIGGDIARANGADYQAFWQKHYAEALGRAKAKMLLRYGLQMVTPNAQNMLIELREDANGKWIPTGTIVFRDIVDSQFVKDVATTIGLLDKSNESIWRDRLTNQIWPNGSLSMMYFHYFESTDQMTHEQLEPWKQGHDKAYWRTIREALGERVDITFHLKELKAYHDSIRRDSHGPPRITGDNYN